MSTDESETSMSTDDNLPAYTEPPERPSEGNLAQHAWDELNRAGLFTTEGDFYGGMTGRSVMEMVEAFSGQGHSGMSAMQSLYLFSTLVQFKPLSALTDDPDEWFCHEGFGPDDTDLWQSKRMSEAFSSDGGKTYWTNTEGRDVLHTSQPHTGQESDDE